MSLRSGDLDTLLATFKGGGWDALEGTSDEIRKRVELKEARSKEEARAIASAWARFAGTPDGEKALQALLDTTLNRTVFFTNLQIPPEQTAIWGAFREGQNAVATQILRQVATGRGEQTEAKSRETPE